MMTKEEAKKILACRGNGYSEEDFNNAIEVAFNCIPSLPSDLDEAAAVYENELWESGYNECGYAPQNIADAFKAGAEWMANQGETFNGYISIKGKRSLIAIEGKSDICKFGDKVIVQIRRNKI